MLLTDLKVARFRNLADVALAPGAGLNLVEGPNAAGKTSLLEAIYLLGRGRSFRSAPLKDLIAWQATDFQVTGSVTTPAGGRTPVGAAYGAAGLRLRLGGRAVGSAAELAQALPLQLINPESHILVSGGPRQRRRYLDWGVFHVEHGFLETWRSYGAALRQRNAALRRRAPAAQIQAWDDGLITAGDRLAALRAAYATALAPLATDYAREFLGADDLVLEFRPGWPRDTTLEDAVRSGLARDREQGFTRYGPHRGELRILWGERPAREHVSRGQQKLIVLALLLAQAAHFRSQAGRRSLFLVDDLAAELDAAHRENVLSALLAQEAQLFVTTVDPGVFPPELIASAARFHVEHGAVGEVI